MNMKVGELALGFGKCLVSDSNAESIFTQKFFCKAFKMIRCRAPAHHLTLYQTEKRTKIKEHTYNY